MFDEKTEQKINEAVTLEIVNAVKRFGADYNSPHEGYAVLLEEVEEAEDDLRLINNNLGLLWESIKSNDLDDTVLLTDIEGMAQMLALEAVQIAAVCSKFKKGL